MKVFFKIVLVLLIISLGSTLVEAQGNVKDSVLSKFNSFHKQVVHEKLYVHIDRNSYIAGETLWFKIYSIEGNSNKPLVFSKVAYVEIIDKNNIPVSQKKILLNEKGGSGSFFISSSIKSGVYKIKAYTQWMKNFGMETCFSKEVSIYNTFRTEPYKSGSPNIQLEFFPEGGNILSGVRNKIAFKAHDQFGRGVECDGVVLNQKNDTIVTFFPFKFGIGSFLFSPERGDQYHVIMKTTNGEQTRHELPPIQEYGYSMIVEDSVDFLRVKISARIQSIKKRHYAYLFVHSNRNIIMAETQPVFQEYAEFIVDKTNLPEGITHITLFDENLTPVAERLVFKRPHKKLLLNLKLDSQNLTCRNRVKIDIVGNDYNKANLSISVYRLDTLEKEVDNGIEEYLWLSSELRGSIEKPEFYFQATEDARIAGDNLMLTHGWRRFSWQSIFKGTESLVYSPELQGLLIKGKITNADGAPAREVTTFLSYPDKTVRLNVSKSNSKGELYFEINEFYDKVKLIIQTLPSDDDSYKVEIEDPFSTHFEFPDFGYFDFSPALKQDLVLRSISMQVQSIFNQEESDFSFPKIDSIAFYGKADQSYLLDDYIRFPVMEEVMREYVQGVTVRKHNNQFNFIVGNNNGMPLRNPLVLLDGIPVFDVNAIMSYDPRKVRKLDVIMHKYYLGPMLIPGIVSYSTYNGDLDGFTLDPKSVVLDYEGLHREKEFYSPKYENDKQLRSRKPDQRHQLFWMPNIVMDNNQAKIEFYTSDIPGTYRVVVEGISLEGYSGTTTSTFFVTK